MINWIALHSDAWTQIQSAKASDRLAHALLLTGASGIGKLAFAEAVAASLLCDQPEADGQACGSCTACTWHASGNHPDFRRLRPEAYSEEQPEAEDAKPAAAKADKKKIFGENAAKLYKVNLKAKRNAMPADALDKLKTAYLEHGGQRENAAYGWVRAAD